MSAPSTRPPPLAVIGGGGTPYTSSPLFSSASESSSTSIMIVTIIISSAVIISASIYLLLRLLSKRFRRTFSTADDVVLRLDSNHPQCHVASNDLLDSLPLFTFRSVTHSHRLNGGDCAVCLTKFEPNDRLRLLPLCCHAFHAACIDKWIVSNQTCPLCRSTVLASGADVLDKILSAENRGNLQLHNSFRDENGNSGSGSFRIEIGSVSLRRGGDAAEALGGGRRRSYSLGAFEYIVDDDCVCEVSVGFTSTNHGRGFSEFASNGKESTVGVPEPAAPVEVLAAEASGGRNWLREYVDRLASISSRTTSFRSSARFFSGSSRRSEAAVVPEDIEANPVGDEIGELFRWLAGI